MKILRLIERIFPVQLVFAHCDVPCGIYKAEPALIAATTVLKMVDKIINPPQLNEKDPDSRRNFHNNMTRYVMVKEQHAEICKREILILWTDFFKAEHLEKWPDLHNKIWQAAKLCSDNKREVNIEKAKALVEATRQIGDILEKVQTAAK